MNYQKLIMELNKRLNNHYKQIRDSFKKDEIGRTCLDYYQRGISKAMDELSELLDEMEMKSNIK